MCERTPKGISWPAVCLQSSEPHEKRKARQDWVTVVTHLQFRHIAGPSPFPSLIYSMTFMTGAGGDWKKGEFGTEREEEKAKLVSTL